MAIEGESTWVWTQLHPSAPLQGYSTDVHSSLLSHPAPFITNTTLYLPKFKMLSMESGWLDTKHLSCRVLVWLAHLGNTQNKALTQEHDLRHAVYGNEANDQQHLKISKQFPPEVQKAREPLRCRCSSEGRADLQLNPSASQGDGPCGGSKSSKSQLLQGCSRQSLSS